MRRLTGEHETAARLEHPQHLAQGQLHIGNVVQHGMSDHEVEGVVVVRDALGIGDAAVDSRPRFSPLRVATLTMPGDRSVTEPRLATPA